MGSKSAFLNIFLGDRIVGRLEKTNYGQMQFYYDSSWLNFEQNLPISLSLPLTSKVYAGEIVESFFRNLLPDNQVILNRIRSRLRISSTHPFDLLASIGRDCVGALQFLKPTETPQKIESKQLPSKDGRFLLTKHELFHSLPLGNSSQWGYR